MKMTLRRFELPLRHRFGISRGSSDVVRSMVVELRQGDWAGYGEAVENAYYCTTLERLAAELEDVRPMVEAATLDCPEDFYLRISAALGDATFTICALDEAAWDLYGKITGRPLWQLWDLSLDELPASSYTIGIDTVESMLHKLDESPGWPVYKIKLGTPDDLEIVSRLRKRTTATFRVDANCGWTVEETIANSYALARLGVEFIEQPLPADDWQGQAEVFRRSALPIIADESCRIQSDIERCRGFFHGVNIKLMKCGGLTPAKRMLAEAERLGLKKMAGCMTESTVGISAAAQLLPLLDYADIDGAELLARYTATGVKVEHGKAVFPAENGTGVRLLG